MDLVKVRYVSKPVDANGSVHYTDEENKIWQELITRQLKIVRGRACDEYLRGLELLKLPHDRIPQCKDISAVLQKTTGWKVEPVPALIPYEYFFQLLASKRFPVSTFIRQRVDLDYIEEPDIFHEAFGHCPLLTLPAYAEFSQRYGKLALSTSKEVGTLLERLYWFTIEFGLIDTRAGRRIYGAGILSSVNETIYALESNIPKRVPFDLIETLSTPYRIDIMQPKYFVLNDFAMLFQLTKIDLLGVIQSLL